MRNILFLSLLIGCAEKTNDSASGEADLTNGESVYTTSCMGCHAGNGYDILALSKNMTDDELRSVITEGKGSMPAQSSLSDSDVNDVIGYIRSQE